MSDKNFISGIGTSALETARLSKSQVDMKNIKPGSFEEKQAKQAAEDFEGILLKQMFDSMWKTVPKNDMLNSRDEEIYRDMYTDAVAKDIASSQKMGIADSIYKELAKKK